MVCWKLLGLDSLDRGHVFIVHVDEGISGEGNGLVETRPPLRKGGVDLVSIELVRGQACFNKLSGYQSTYGDTDKGEHRRRDLMFMGTIDERRGEEIGILGGDRLGPLEEGRREKGKHTWVGIWLGPWNTTFARLQDVQEIVRWNQCQWIWRWAYLVDKWIDIGKIL